MKARQIVRELVQFPWRSAARTLGERIVEDRLPLSAGSLTFTTTIALVPFFTVILALFTAFPVFSRLQGALQAWLVQSLVPDAISRQVLGYLTQFAASASRLGIAGLMVLVVSALALVLTIDRTLNGIWRVKRGRPLAQRLLIYWALLTVGPMLLASSLSISSYLVSSSRGFINRLPGGFVFVLDAVELVMLAAGLAAMYRFVPNMPVRWRHAAAGGVFAAAGIEVARRLLALYLVKVPTYSVMYGAFASVPILLVWIYIVWLVVLLGAVLTAYLPSLLAGPHRKAQEHGWHFQLALEVMRALREAQPSVRRGLTLRELAAALQVTDLQLEPVLEALMSLDWIGRLMPPKDEEDARYLLLADVQSTALEPLIRMLLLPPTEATERLWHSGRLSTLYLKDAL